MKAIAFELSGVPDDENIVNLEWLGECDATADELLSGGKSNGDYDAEPIQPKFWPRDRAKRFLLNTLSDTPMDKTKRGAAAIREGNIWTGMLKCADCGNNLSYNNPGQRRTAPFFSCNLYKRHTKRCTSHYITIPSIEKLVLDDIRIKAAFAKKHEGDLLEYARLAAAKESERDTRQMQLDLEKWRSRCGELDTIMKRIVEQNALGMLADERFMALSRDYEAEQAEIKHKINEVQLMAIKQKSDSENAVKFHSIVRQYTEIEELTVSILHELIDRIKIYNAVGLGKSRTQEVEINYRYVGHLPSELTSQ